MVICYTPIAGVNFTAGGGWSMYTEGYGTKPECIATLITTTPDMDCPNAIVGDVKLNLPITTNLRDQCGTRRYYSSVSIKSVHT